MASEYIFKKDLKLKRVHYELNETIVTIIAENNHYIEIAINEIKKCRKVIEKFIRKDEFFKITYEPYKYDKDAPEIIKKMCESSKKFNIGPMSTVAGIIAEYAVKAMVIHGAKHAIVDNGGDIAIYSDRTVNIGIYTGNDKTGKIAFRVSPKNKIIGICTSSGKIGHSISFGNTDAVIVISDDLSIADAAATALGNQVNNDCDLKNAYNILRGIKGVISVTIIIDERIGFWGEIPDLVTANVPYKLITRGR